MGFKFVQLDGPRKTLILTDHYGPMGRSRVAPVVADGLEIIDGEVRYFGNPEPTRFIGPTKLDDWELNGRFWDRRGGDGFAKAKTEECKAFVDDKQQVLITWDDIVAAKGLIQKFTPEREAPGDVKYKFLIRIDTDEIARALSAIPDKIKPRDYTNQILEFSTELDTFGDLPLKGSIFDAFNSLIDVVANATAAVQGIADDMASFEESTIALLRRFRVALGQLKTALITMRGTIDALQVDLAIESHNADDRLSFSSAQAAISLSTLQSLKTIADADRSATLAERGQISSVYSAKAGDTWESISAQFYGNASRAGDIREANNIPTGAAPQPGAIYQIPT